ncbi:putative DUF3489 domain-containing protein [Gammaproteobacteria bacterium]
MKFSPDFTSNNTHSRYPDASFTFGGAPVRHAKGKIERFPQGLSGSALVMSLEALERKSLASNDGQGHWTVTPEGYKAMGRKHPSILLQESAAAEAAQAHQALIAAVFEPGASEPEMALEPAAASEPGATIEPELIATEPEATIEPEAIVESATVIEPETAIEPESAAIESEPTATEPEPATKPRQTKVCPHCGHALTTPATRTRESSKPRENSKQDLVVQMLKRPEGATIEQIMANTGWQSHSTRGFLSGALKKKMGLTITSEKVDGLRTYRAE